MSIVNCRVRTAAVEGAADPLLGRDATVEEEEEEKYEEEKLDEEVEEVAEEEEGGVGQAAMSACHCEATMYSCAPLSAPLYPVAASARA